MTCKYPVNSRSYKFCLGCSDIGYCEDAVTSNIPIIVSVGRRISNGRKIL